MPETRTTLHPEYLLGHSNLPRSMVWKFFGSGKPATRLDVDLIKVGAVRRAKQGIQPKESQ